MKATFNRKGMEAAFGLVSGIAPARSAKPILGNVKLTAGPDGAWLTATDLEVGIRHRVVGLRAEGDGSVVLPTAKFGAILKTSADEELDVRVVKDKLVVSGSRSTFNLPCEDPELFPEVPGFDAAEFHAVSSADLKRLIRRTHFATDPESTRYALGGVLVEAGGEGLAFVGTDGRRLAKATCPVQSSGPDLPASPVVPVKALKLFDRVLDDSEDPAHLAFTATAALLRTDRAVVYSRLVEGRFPRYQDVFPPGEPAAARFTAGPLRESVEQASIVTSEESRGVDFAFAPGSLTLSSQAADVGSSKVEAAAAYEGPERTFAIDPQYVLPFLKTLDPDAEVSVELCGDKDAVVFRAGGDYTYVVMPLTRDRA